MFEQNMNPSDYKFKSIDLSDPNEFVTRIQGVESLCITKLIFTTNLGHKVEIGNDFAPHKNTEENPVTTQKIKQFEAQIPKDAQVVCLGGAYDNKSLLSLYTYYS